VNVTVSASIYSYEVANLHTSPIVGFQIGQYHCYSFEVPDGWEREISPDILRAWTDKPLLAIGSGGKAKFSQRVTSRGAVLGKSDLVLKFASGEKTAVTGVWAPVSEPAAYARTIAAVVLLIVVTHTVYIVRRRRAEK
jgi:hypothetical protein